MVKITLRFCIVQVMSLLTLVLFISLGTWQLNRGNVKDDIEKSNSNQDVEFQQVRMPLKNLPNWRYKKIKLHGVYDSTKQFLLDNQVRDGATGYNVLTPFYVRSQDCWVLVDRGWVALTTNRDELPSVDIDSDASLTISGSVYVPYDDAYTLGGIAEGEDSGWPRRIQFVDYQQLSDRLGVNLEPFTLRLSASEKYGYRRDWIHNSVSAQKHYGYAFQWYAMALALLVLWWIYSIKPLVNRYK